MNEISIITKAAEKAIPAECSGIQYLPGRAKKFVAGMNRPRFADLFHHLKRPVVVTVIAMRMMQVSINQIVQMIAMWNGCVATVGAMNVLPVVAFRAKCAFVRIDVTHRDDVFVHVVAMRMMKMAVVKIIHMSGVHDGDVTAIFAVDMRMIGVSFARM
jgi:hypothetical protein